MVDIHRVRRTEHVTRTGTPSISGGGSGSAGDSFREHLGHQLKDEYRKRVSDLFDELTELAGTLECRIDISVFERYRGQLKELLTEALKNAYIFSPEYITDMNGRQRVYATINVIDSRLDDLAKVILSENDDRLDYLSRVDEIRGLIMDMLL